jgi:hypothetical protein
LLTEEEAGSRLKAGMTVENQILVWVLNLGWGLILHQP